MFRQFLRTSGARSRRFPRRAPIVAGAAAAFVALAVTSASAQRIALRQIGGADVNVITGTETYPHVTQSEHQIAVNGSTVAIAYNDSRGVTANPISLLGLSVSTNGGTSYTRLTPSPFNTHGNSYGDPVLVYNKKLAKWFAGSLAGGCGGTGVGLWTSTDATSWTTGACAHSGADDSRPSMWVDNTPASPFYGRMFVSFNDFSLASDNPRITHSDDGVTWTTPVTLGLPTGSSFIRNLEVRVAPDGTVLLVGMHEGGGGFNPRRNYLYRSTDGGATFSAPISMGASFATPGDSICPSQPYYTRINPIWRNASWGDLAVGSSGVAVYSYTVHGTGADGGDIYVVRSTDSGLNWGAPVRVDGDVSANAQWMSSTTGGGTNFLVSWYDRRNTTDGSNYERWGTISTDGGLTWSTPDRISDILIPQPEQVDPNIIACYAGNLMRGYYDGNTFYDGWTDGRVAINDGTGTPHNQMDVFVDKLTLTPTGAQVASFAARPSSAGIELTWRTASELQAFGFDIWRSVHRNGGFAKVTRAMIRARAPGTARGASYRFVDRRAPHGRAYYRLQLVGADGGRSWLGGIVGARA